MGIFKMKYQLQPMVFETLIVGSILKLPETLLHYAAVLEIRSRFIKTESCFWLYGDLL
jgi:hypothetical protein